ncbi:phenylacetic acid degradation operon negative regulatory protein PaaX [Hwanghaeella grinnelliae]|uniref:Phenylacetic acid degradation operon negative regulatory protein PaaX n=1 Tax=Hwanghaeella grinnelliae TaxID=2500179 RepID=A0A437QWH0_9PROT|nr:PaaX family transcriptional regulator C-terminal domain-containing protein [Hwanghaeella grinnelliae]RVU38885.1 phenylacetic acid degradation operon negative regulatory protein PaaX [Hwanghaeella grinnelliae]
MADSADIATSRAHAPYDSSADPLVARLLSEMEIRGKSMIVTVFGDAIVPHGGAIWLSDLIRLMEPFGVGERVVRTAVYRLSQDAYFDTTKEGRRSFYSLTKPARLTFDAAERRIYAGDAVPWDEQWTVLILTGGLSRRERAAAVKQLGWQGFAQIGPNLLVNAVPAPEAVAQTLDSLGIADKVVEWRAGALPGVKPDALHQMIRDAWPLDTLQAKYRNFLTLFGTAAAGLDASEPQQPHRDAERAFVLRSLLVHAWRRIVLNSPALPLEIHPDPGLAAEATELYQDLYLNLAGAADAHVAAVMAKGDYAPPPKDYLPAPALDQRFGGLLEARRETRKSQRVRKGSLDGFEYWRPG